ncbi:MAG: HDOD domain-containing protein [Deltaproteobacteria bacterium]|nr:HDOD domain-containing protein [Deltaproteobacteria bacterium]MBI4795840.1 HDOD domain-containing protein [Deltaproteobacteria bacterium]
MGIKILFVDDEPKVLEAMQRMLRSMRKEWETAFALSGQEALEILGRESFDVVVSDMRMPGMDGTQLLAEVKKRYPDIVRIVLSGQSDKEMVLKSVQPAHQYLAKPCDAETLKSTINRACTLRDLFTDNALRLVVSQLDSLPSLPDLYAQIMKELQSEYSSIRKIGEIISKDIGMTAKVLQLVNSAFFGHIRHVSSPAQAAELLGLETIKTLVLSVKIFSQFDRFNLPNFSVKGLWDHSMATGVFSRTIAIREKQTQEVIDDAFMAGVLHDAGKLILAANFARQYREVIETTQQRHLPLWQAENQVFGVTHAKVGAYLFSLWGLPYSIVEAIAFHHDPSAAPQKEFGPLTAVHAANYLEHHRRQGDADKGEAVDSAYLTAIGMVDQLGFWEEKCSKAIKEEEDDN